MILFLNATTSGFVWLSIFLTGVQLFLINSHGVKTIEIYLHSMILGRPLQRCCSRRGNNDRVRYLRIARKSPWKVRNIFFLHVFFKWKFSDNLEQRINYETKKKYMSRQYYYKGSRIMKKRLSINCLFKMNSHQESLRTSGGLPH